MKIAVVGGRKFQDYDFLRTTLNAFNKRRGIDWIVSGGAVGADTLAERWAREVEILGYTVYLPQWSIDGERAGYRRNLRIVESSEIVIAFLHPTSKGTLHSIKLAKKLGVGCIECYSPLYYPGSEQMYKLIGSIK